MTPKSSEFHDLKEQKAAASDNETADCDMVKEGSGKNGGNRIKAQLSLTALYKKKKKGKPRADPEDQILPVYPFLSVRYSLSADTQSVIYDTCPGAKARHSSHQQQLLQNMIGNLH